MLLISSYFLFIFIPLLGLPWIIWQLQDEHRGVVQTIWYFFFLACCATPIVTEGAIAIKAIGENGEPLTSLGHFLRVTLLPAIFDIKSDILILMALVILIVLPQLLTYAVCGMFGCATAPMWISGSINLLFWGLAKSLSVAGGVLISFTFFCIEKKWILFRDLSPYYLTNNLPDIVRSLATGSMFISSAFVLIWLFLFEKENPLLPHQLVKFAQRVHTWATRCIPVDDE